MALRLLGKWVKQNNPDNRHKASVAAHYDHHHRVLFPAPASLRAGNKTRHNNSASAQAAVVTAQQRRRDGCAP